MVVLLATRATVCGFVGWRGGSNPSATDEEIRASSLQFVRKLSGFPRPSRANEHAFTRAVDHVAQAARELLDSLVTTAPPRDRAVEGAKARAKAAGRFARPWEVTKP